MRLRNHITPRDWQIEALGAWRTDCKGIVHVVTGGGKTVFSYLCIEHFFLQHPLGKVLIIVPTIALMDQWYVDIHQSMEFTEDDVSCRSGRDKNATTTAVTILVINTARALTTVLSSHTDTMLVVDECHRAGSPVNSLALDGEYTATLGLSATPEREFDDGFHQYLVPALGPLIFSYDFDEARRDKVIVDFELINIATTLDETDVARSKELTARLDLDLAPKSTSTDSKLHRTLRERLIRQANVAIRAAWATKIANAHLGERIIIFHERVTALRRIAKLLELYGRAVVTYHSHLSSSHRRDNLLLFRQGKVDCLVTCRALDEGTNVPEANIAIIARSTSSTRQRIQRLGRVLRPAKGKKHSTIYTLYCSDEEQSHLEEEEHNLQGVARITWKRGRVQ